MTPDPTSGVALPYLARLICLSFSAGLVAYLAGTLVSAALAPLALRRVAAAGPTLRHPADAARWLLGLRLLPLLLSVFLVGGLCVPSYFRLEQHGMAEHVGWGFCLVSLGGALLAAVALQRLWRAGWSARRFTLGCQARSETLQMGDAAPILVLADPTPLMALAGILHPRLMVSRSILERLSPEQLEAGLRHERAHQRARDNLKRLLLVATPALGPTQRLRALERAWAKLVEWAADDSSVGCDTPSDADNAQRSLALASALVEVARMGSAAIPAAAVSYLTHFSLTGNGSDLADRVQRLLDGRASVPQPRRRAVRLAVGAGAALLLTLMLQPATLAAVHELTERLLH